VAVTRREALAYLAAALAGIAGAAVVRATPAAPRVVRITARRFAFEPRVIELKRGEPVVLELATLDRRHGFDAPTLGLQADLVPGETVRVPLLPDRAGRHGFVCNVFCGEGHDEMDGEIMVTG